MPPPSTEGKPLRCLLKFCKDRFFDECLGRVLNVLFCLIVVRVLLLMIIIIIQFV